MGLRFAQGGEGFIVVYAINSRDAFDEVTTFRDQILRVKDADKVSELLAIAQRDEVQTSETKHLTPCKQVPMVICGNKCDLAEDRQVTKAEGEDLARSFGVPFFETSALSRINVDESFFELGELCTPFPQLPLMTLSSSVREIRKARKANTGETKPGSSSKDNKAKQLIQKCTII